jgi:hypothetical protein
VCIVWTKHRCLEAGATYVADSRYRIVAVAYRPYRRVGIRLSEFSRVALRIQARGHLPQIQSALLRWQNLRRQTHLSGADAVCKDVGRHGWRPQAHRDVLVAVLADGIGTAPLCSPILKVDARIDEHIRHVADDVQDQTDQRKAEQRTEHHWVVTRDDGFIAKQAEAVQ